jgi:ABC-type nitrate/sulfonate/bicarbonate transport system ATPase subunit
MPTTGDLTWNDQSIVGPRCDIGFIFQESRLMPWLTVTANVRLGLGPANQSKALHWKETVLKSLDPALVEEADSVEQEKYAGCNEFVASDFA